MNQGKDDALQQAIDQATQSATKDTSNTTENTQADPIVPQRNMTSDKKNSTNDEAVAAVMASVLPDSNTTTTPPTLTPPPIVPTPAPSPTPKPEDKPVLEPTSQPEASPVAPSTQPAIPTDMSQVKEQALRELSPLLANMQINPEQKFKIYRDMFETLHDNSVAMPALEAAKQIQDENSRAEALLYLVNLIDGLNSK